MWIVQVTNKDSKVKETKFISYLEACNFRNKLLNSQPNDYISIYGDIDETFSEKK